MPPSLEELQDTIQHALTDAGIDAATLSRHPGSTIEPRKRADTGGKRAFALLQELGARAGVGPLDLHGTIGEGGMGVVRLGTQRTLGREVAVKTLKAEHRSDEATLKLLREAWVTGRLEHPNVVPIYDIALDADGSPQIVLKKIEGDEWAELMHDPAAIKARFGTDDPLEWNLRTLLSVCNAVRFAHSRDILHRDIKPENVMVGSFGEVYVVDWGIAVSLADDGSGRLPLASEARELAGTPLYMAPEMLGGPQSRLSIRTDVYLLGAVLYEIVCGAPPHRGEQFMELVASIVDSCPPIPSDVPEELHRIIRRATDPDPDARFENAEQLRLAVQAFLNHRDATELAARAEQRLEELGALLDREAVALDGDEEAARLSAPDDGELNDASEAVYHLFGECRFGFRHALEVWPENESARAGLDRALVRMVEYELTQGQPSAARALIGEMDRVPGELLGRVEAAQRARAKEDARLRRLHDDLDPTKGRRTRFFATVVIGVLWTVMPLLAQLALSVTEMEVTHVGGVGMSIFFLTLLTGFFFWARDSLTRTAINRRIGVAALLAMSLHLVASLVGWAVDRPPLVTYHEQFLVWAAIAAMLASSVDTRLVIAAIGFVVGYAVVPLVGMDNVFYVISACDLCLLLVCARLWADPKDDLEATRAGLANRRAKRRAWLAAHFAPRSGE